MKSILLSLSLFVSVFAFASDTVTNIYPLGVAIASGPDCDRSTYKGIANYTKTLANGWGYAPITNGNTSFVAVYTNSVNVNIQALGQHGDNYCSTSNSVTIPNPPPSPKYRFILFFHSTNDVPSGTNQCPLTVTNLNQ